MLLVSALLLGGFVYYSEIQRTQKQEAVKTTKQPIFYFEQDDIKSLTIYIDEETLEFERVTGQSTDWQMKSPKDVPASNAAVAFLVNLLVNGKIERRFTVPATQNKLQEYGLDKPLATIRVERKNQQIHRLILGKPDFNSSFLYAQADPSNQTPQPLEVLLVPIDFKYAVTRPLSEWRSKLSPTPKTSPASPTPTNSKPSPTPKTSPASPTPANSKPSPTPKSSPASPTPANSKPSPTPKTSPASPTPANSKPSPTPKTSPASPTPANSQPSPTPKTSPASPTPANSQPSPTPKTSPASPTPANSQPSPATEKR
jgi:hypothetical protein